MNRTTVDDVQRFGDWLARMAPEHQQTRRLYHLEKSAPPALAAIAEQIGWSQWVAFRQIPRQAPARRAFLAKFPSAEPVLPKRARILATDLARKTASCIYLDESEESLPVFALENAKCRRLADDGIDWWLRKVMLRVALPRVAPCLPGLTVARPFECALVTGAWTLALGVWAMGGFGEPQDLRPQFVLAESSAHFWAWLETLTAAERVFVCPLLSWTKIRLRNEDGLDPREVAAVPGFASHHRPDEGVLARLLAPTKAIGYFTFETYSFGGWALNRTLPREAATWNALGTLAGEQVWIDKDDNRYRNLARVHVAAEGAARVRQWLDAHGYEIDSTSVTEAHPFASQGAPEPAPPPSLAPNTASAETVRREAALLGELLTRFRPDAPTETLQLEPSAHPHSAALWEGVGWRQKLFARLYRPDGEHRERARKTLRSYRMPSKFELTLAELPEKFRIVFIDEHDTRFLIVDEDDREQAPPLRMIDGDTGRVVPVGDACQMVAGEALDAIMAAWPEVTLQSLSGDPIAIRGSTPLVALAPQLAELAPDVWATTTDPRFVRVRCPSLQALFDWLPKCPEGVRMKTSSLRTNQLAMSVEIPLSPAEVVRRLSSPVACGVSAREVASRLAQYALATRNAPVPPTAWVGELVGRRVLLAVESRQGGTAVHMLYSPEHAAEIQAAVAAFTAPDDPRR